MKRNFFFASLLIGACLSTATPSMAQDKLVKLTTVKEIGQSITIAVNHSKGITVDWGDGQAVPYQTDKTEAIFNIEGKVKGEVITVSGGPNWRVLSCKNCGITNIDLSQAKKLQSLYCQNNKIDSLNLSGMTSLIDLDCSNNNISKLIFTQGSSAKEDLASLESFNISNNKMEGKYNLKIEKLKHLNVANNNFSNLYVFDRNIQTIICNNNKIKSYLNLNSMKNLNNLVCGNNEITSLMFATNGEQMKQLYCENNKIESIDLEKADGLLALVCSNNNIKSYNASKESAPNIIYVDNNSLTFSCLPSKREAPKYLSFEPQNAFDLSKAPGVKTKDGIPYIQLAPSWAEAREYGINLQKECSLSNGRTDAYFAWYSINPDGSETQLKQRKNPSGEGDFYANSGIFGFFNPYKKAYVKLTSRSYGFVIKSLPIAIGDDVTAVENVTAANNGLTVSVADGAIVLNSNTAIVVNIFTIDGKQVWKNTISGETSVSLPKGVYVVNGKKVIL